MHALAGVGHERRGSRAPRRLPGPRRLFKPTHGRGRVHALGRWVLSTAGAERNVGVVIVSHSPHVARGAADMVRQMVGESVPLASCGGDPAGGLGPTWGRFSAAIEAAWSGAGRSGAGGPRGCGDEHGDGDRDARREPPRTHHDLQRRDRGRRSDGGDGSLDGECPRGRLRRGRGRTVRAEARVVITNPTGLQRAPGGEARPARGGFRCRRRDPRGRSG